MCELRIEGKKAIVDLSKCPYEFGSPEFINYHLKNLTSIIGEYDISEIIYEEEITFVLSKEGVITLIEYAKLLNQIEGLMLRKDIYGHPSDPNYQRRYETLKKFLEYAYMNPIQASYILENYKEGTPSKSIFYKGQQIFLAWINNILKAFKSTRLYNLVKEYGDLKKAFLSLIGLQTLYFINLISLELPKNAKPIKEDKSHYTLPYGYEVQLYEIKEKDLIIYHVKHPVMEKLSKEKLALLKELIENEMRENFVGMDFSILFNLKVNEYKAWLIEQAILKGIELTQKEAFIMAREAASWTVGLGSPIENISLDNENVTDIYIDSENSPLYIEHREYGIAHTLFRYNRELLERAFINMVFSEPGKRFDEKFPVVDVYLTRLNMRCHLQRPPATFGELQGALRIMKEEPFTYPQYLYFHSFTPFFAGYDDVLVNLGASEAVLGVKGSGKTSFTAAKIASIGPSKRIVPIQDIWEIPVRAYRKRGFHIGAVKVAGGDFELRREEGALDLVTMANALLRMGDAALIINEVRSRTAVQGIINLLNTQPGVFLLYNLHAESLEDIRDRLELVFGIPAASMFATDRYTFLKKITFGRKGKIYRVLGFEYESDRKSRKFTKIFEFERGNSIEDSTIKPLFLKNPLGQAKRLDKVDFKRLEKELDIVFIPPILARRAEDKGLDPIQLIVQAFFKGKVFYDIYSTAVKLNLLELMHLDFFLKANLTANRIIYENEQEHQEVDFAEVNKKWEEEFKKLAKDEIEMLKSKG